MTKSDRSLRNLASRYFDGGLDAQELNELSELIVSNQEAAKEYANLAAIHSSLNTIVPPELSSVVIDRRSDKGMSSAWGITFGGLLGIAASLLFMLSFSWLLPQSQQSAQVATSVPIQPGQSEYIAHITRKIDCDYQSDRWQVATSSGLVPGQTVLMQNGLMEIEYQNGVKVTLEAPVTYTLETEMRSVLTEGKLRAQVPEAARGFTVTTPKGNVVDLGTVFGVSVDGKGEAETHVFEGEVVVHPLSGEKVSLLTDEALELRGRSKVTRMPSKTSRFTSLDFRDVNEIQHPEVDRDLVLWLDASHRVQTDDNGKVVAWGDIRSESNLVAQDAWQVNAELRPRLKSDSINGKAAIAFGGTTGMVTEPIVLGANYSVVAVIRLDLDEFAKLRKSMNPNNGIQVFNANGPPNLVLAVNRKHKITSWMYTGFRKGPNGSHHRSHSIMSSGEKLTDLPAAIAVVYSSDTNSSSLYINGKLVASEVASIVDETSAPRYIGSHFKGNHNFSGEIAELLVFDTDLTAAEVEQIANGQMNKYQISAKEE